MRKQKRGGILKSKKGISIMVGYVLLIGLAIIMGAVTYQWMKTYVPKESLECVDGVSFFIKEINCAKEGENFILNLTLKNNGRFNIAGYFIHATEDSEQELATIDLSKYITGGGSKFGSAIKFSSVEENSMKPNTERISKFYLTNEIYLIEIIPVRFQTKDNKKSLVSCGGSKIKEVVVCRE